MSKVEPPLIQKKLLNEVIEAKKLKDRIIDSFIATCDITNFTGIQFDNGESILVEK